MHVCFSPSGIMKQLCIGVKRVSSKLPLMLLHCLIIELLAVVQESKAPPCFVTLQHLNKLPLERERVFLQIADFKLF